MLRVRRPEGDGLSPRAGGRCSGRVVVQGRPELSCCSFTSHGETGCLSVPGVAARKGWSPSEGQSPGAAGSPARGRPVVPMCQWLLEGWSLRGGQSPPAAGHRPPGGWLPLCPVVGARKGRPLRGGQSPPSAGSTATGRPVSSPCRRSLLRRVVAEGRLKPSFCGLTGHAETVCLSMLAVAACEGRLLRGGQSPRAACTPPMGKRVAPPCRRSLVGRGGRCGEARALVQRLHRLEGDGLPFRAAQEGLWLRGGQTIVLRVHRPRKDTLSLCANGRCSGGVVAVGSPEPSCYTFTGQGELGLSLFAGGRYSGGVVSEEIP